MSNYMKETYADSYNNHRSMSNRCIQVMLIEVAGRYLNDDQYTAYIAEAIQWFKPKTEADIYKYFLLVEEMHNFFEGRLRKNYWRSAMAQFEDYLLYFPHNRYLEIAAKYR